MGWLKIRARHEKLALSDSCLDSEISTLDTPEKMLAHYERKAKKRGIKIIPKTSRFRNWSKMTTTFRWNIRAGRDYESYSTQQKAITLTHEWPHVEQWDTYLLFGPRYLGARWGWAMEMQAYRQTIRGMKALGFKRNEIDQYIKSRADSLWEHYWLMRQIRRSDFDKFTLKVLRTEA